MCSSYRRRVTPTGTSRSWWRQSDGTVIVLAGQSHETASAFAADVTALRAVRDGHPQPLPATPAWMKRLLALDPARVVFAHDGAVWEP